MKLLILALACVSALATLPAIARTEQVQQISREQIAKFDQLPHGFSASVTGDPEHPVIQVVSEGARAGRVNLATIRNPLLNAPCYAIRGEISYSDVTSDGFMEMWIWFGEAESYFSRAVAEAGPMGKLSAQSGWRGFSLPFNALTRSSPTKLELDINLPSRGNVTVRNLRLVQTASFEELQAGQPAWWTERTVGWAAGLVGAVIGCLGSLLEFLASRGRARSFVVGTAWALAGLGAASLGAGLMAVATVQTPGLSYALLLMGVLCVVIFPVRLRRYLRHYEQTELRRMDSVDAVGA